MIQDYELLQSELLSMVSIMTNNEFNQAINRNRLKVHYAEIEAAMMPIMK